MIKAKHIAGESALEFSEELDKQLKKIQEELFSKVIDIKYAESDHYFSAIIIYEDTFNQ
jgi:hypothetical protein